MLPSDLAKACDIRILISLSKRWSAAGYWGGSWNRGVGVNDMRARPESVYEHEQHATLHLDVRLLVVGRNGVDLIL